MAFTATSPTGQSFSSATEWYDQYMADLAALGGTLAQEEPAMYEGPRIAEWTPDQQRAFSQVRDAQDMWKPYVDPAMESMYAGQGGLNKMQNLIDQSSTFNRYSMDPSGFAGDGGMFYSMDPSAEGSGGSRYVKDGVSQNVAAPGGMAYDQFYDIYSNPMREMQAAADSIGNRNFQNTTLKSLSDAFTGTGQFGSGRHQILGADAAAQAQAQIEEAKAGIGMQATQNAMGDYYKWGQQGLQGAQQMGNYSANQARMGTDLMNFGLGTQQAAMADASAMGNIGQQQQTMNQQNLSMAYQDFQDQQNYPWQQLDKWSSLMRGSSIPNYQSQVQLPAVVPTTYQNPWLSGMQGAGGGWQLGSSFK
jgi:hypothetical protein